MSVYLLFSFPEITCLTGAAYLCSVHTSEPCCTAAAGSALVASRLPAGCLLASQNLYTNISTYLPTNAFLRRLLKLNWTRRDGRTDGFLLGSAERFLLGSWVGGAQFIDKQKRRRAGNGTLVSPDLLGQIGGP